MAAGIAATRDNLAIDSRVDAGQRRWLRPLSMERRSLGGRAFRGHARSKESLCGCGGRGHLEGILGHRAMRMRFLDLEPDEVIR